MANSIFEYCKDAYNNAYNAAFTSFLNGKSRTKKVEEDAERYAQKTAIREALKNGVAQFPLKDVSDVWKSVYKVHIYELV